MTTRARQRRAADARLQSAQRRLTAELRRTTGHPSDLVFIDWELDAPAHRLRLSRLFPGGRSTAGDRFA